MALYYVARDAQSNGDHEVHVAGCDYIPNENNRLFLGERENSAAAVEAAKKHYPQSNGCYYCCNECHKR